MRIQFKNVRTFYGKHEISLKPLNILVGENSSGKSTFLAVTHFALNGKFLSFAPHFNDAPYDLGSFENIVTNRGSDVKKEKSFSIGYVRGEQDNYVVSGTFVSDLGEPRLCELTLEADNVSMIIEYDNTKIIATLSYKPNPQIPNGYKTRNEIPFPRKTTRKTPIQALLFGAVANMFQSDEFLKQNQQLYLPLINNLILLNQGSSVAQVSAAPGAISLAPIRTRPSRVYPETTSEFSPEGEHIPYVLARLLLENDDESKLMADAIKEFGKESELFASVSPKRLVRSKEHTGPFQILINIAGPKRNLTDVGYGISQSLPIIVETVLAAPSTFILIQQPEVHLHPKAQAGLGTFFSRMVARNQKRFLIETHSDYLIDRIRQEIAQGTIKSTDCQILYFERKRTTSKVISIQIDEHGNLSNTPRGYRQFFLDENLRIFNRLDK